MRSREVQTVIALILMVSLTAGALWPVAAQESPGVESEAVYLRLKYATFDPLAGEPAMPAGLRQESYAAGGEGTYIVQFPGPIEEEWPIQLRAMGARVVDYLPDYAYLVWMDGEARAAVEGWKAVRWVGLYQPAYKLSPSLDRSQPLYRVVLFEGADLAAVEARLATLDTPTITVPGEVFNLVLPGGDVETVATWPEVLWIENRPVYEWLNDVAGGIMNSPTAWASGYTGSGVMVTVADSGIDTGTDTAANGDIHADFDNRMVHIQSWPVQDDGCAGCCYTNIGADDGAADLNSGHGTHVLGSVGGNGAASAGQFRGGAYQASLTFQAVEQWTTFSLLCGGGGGYSITGIPLDLNLLFQQAYDWGSRIHSNSWGADLAGQYTSDSQAVDEFIWNHPDMTILFSAGNAGIDANDDGYVDGDSIGSPATAKNSIAVGATDNERTSGGLSTRTWGQVWPSDYQVPPTSTDLISDNRAEMAAFSSRGPTDDGRLKPDVVAPGTDIISARSSVAANAFLYYWGPYNAYYMYMGGTSMAAPLTTGAAALVYDYYNTAWSHPHPSAALIKATLVNAATDIAGYGNTSREAGQPIPNNHEGWGRVNVGAATAGSRRYHDSDSVTAGFTATYIYQVNSPTVPLKVTLAWSDYPGALPAGGLVNDLNLEVVSPGGTTYRGNAFSGGWSVAGGLADNTNNVESVYVQSPAVGQWTVRVTGANVPFGPQPFALVLTASFSPPTSFTHFAYLPVVAKNAPSGTQNGIANGDFEDGPTAWTEYSDGGFPLIVDGGYLPEYVAPHSGNWVTWLGGAPSVVENAYIEQMVTVPADKPYLAYWHWIDSDDAGCGSTYDVGRVVVDGDRLKQYNLCGATDTGGWSWQVLNLGPYVGRTVPLRFRIKTDAIGISNWFLDDVSFAPSVQEATSEAPPVPAPAPAGRTRDVAAKPLP